MFCSKCGKTIAPDQTQCPYCSAEVGQSRFEGVPYTSVQPRFESGRRSNYAQSLGYTRTTYTGMNPEREDSSDVDARTTYRPAYEGASAPDDVRRDMRSDMEGDSEPQTAMPDDEQFRRRVDLLDKELELEDVDLTQFKSRPIRRREQAGISPDVTDYMNRLEATQERRAARRGSVLRPRRTTGSEDNADYDDYNPTDADQDGIPYDDQDREEFNELHGSLARLDLPRLLKISAALVLVAALFVGGVVWFCYVSKKSVGAPIEGVTLDFYNAGIAQIEKNASSDRINQLIALYNAEGLVSMNTSLSQDALDIAALLPASPAGNDQLFLDALYAIETNIGNAVTMDVLALTNTSETAVADSEARWNIVSTSISQLKAATSAAELTAITNGERISVAATPTPAPSSAAYTPLSKGDKSDAVLDLQTRLYELGFYLEDRDGAYGNNTMTAVKLFQTAAGLSVTGIADSETQAAIYSDTAPRTQYAPSAAATAPSETIAPTIAPSTDPTEPAAPAE